MTAALLVSLLLTFLHSAVLSILSTAMVVLQLVIVAIVLAFYFRTPALGWQIALFSGLSFDLFSGLRFGAFIAIFVTVAATVALALNYRDRWGDNLTLAVTTATITVGYVVITMSLSGYPLTQIWSAAIYSSLLTTVVLFAVRAGLLLFAKKE